MSVQLRRGLTAAAVSLALLALAGAASADARSDYLIRLLQGSSQFRVRAQAAISLGSVGASAEVLSALSVGLADEHPAVRAAAANSLGKLADPKALPALRKVASDPEVPVRSAATAAIAALESAARRSGVEVVAPRPTGPPRYYVAVARPATRVAELGDAELSKAEETLRDRLTEIDGVVLAERGESAGAARSVLKARNLKGYYIESSITSVEQKSGGTRVAVSVILATYPDRSIRAMMQGAATAIGGADPRGQATASALKSALNQLPTALSRE